MAVPLKRDMDERENPLVLIVDDQPRNLDVLEVMLEGMECTLVRADSADAALLQVVRHDFAALIIDIKMPGMNGIELATLIKQRKRSKHVPIVLLTAHPVDEGDLLLGYGAGAIDYLSKPINPQILRHKIGIFVEAFRNARALEQLNLMLQSEVQERQRAQEALRLSNADLERRVQDRTEALVRAHRGVRENEERLRMALDVARIAAWEWHLKSDHMRWSTDPEVLFGFPSASFGPQLRISRVVHPGDRQRVEMAIAGARARGFYEAEYRAVRPDGSILWVTERGQVVPESDTDRMVGITRDVTRDRELAYERELLLAREREARNEAERQGRLKDEFLATLSHELRTPMNAILGWLEMIQSGKATRDTAYALDVITRNARIQARLIEDLLDMNRLMSGTISLEWAPVEVHALLRTTMSALQPTADAKGVELVETEPLVESAVVHADARRLEQVLRNVLQNAIKFTPSSGRVEGRVLRSGEEYQVVVSDTGQGISPTFLPHVFDRFRQQDASSTRESSGLGLGLAIAKQLVELHGGTIRAESSGEGKGATFIIGIPAAVSRQPLSQSQ